MGKTRTKLCCAKCYKKWVNHTKDGIAMKVDPPQGTCDFCKKPHRTIIASVIRYEKY